MRTLLLLLLLVTPLIAQESVTLATPVQAVTGVTLMRPAVVTLDAEHGVIVIVMKEFSAGAYVAGRPDLTVTYDASGSYSFQNGVKVSDPAPTGAALIVALNKANLATTSLEKRIIQQLQTDGHLPAGPVNGSPQ